MLRDTLEQGLHDEPGGGATLLLVRPHHRRGARLANACALAAVVGMLREAAGRRVVPVSVTFAHPRPESITEAHSWFGCPVRCDGRRNAVGLDAATLATWARLADRGLSSFLLARLERPRSELADRSLVPSVHATVCDLLP